MCVAKLGNICTALIMPYKKHDAKMQQIFNPTLHALVSYFNLQYHKYKARTSTS